MSVPTVYVTDFLQANPDLEQEELGDLAEVGCCAATDESELAPVLPIAEALMVWHTIKLGPATINGLERCRLLVRAGVGYDNIDIEAAAARGIPVCNVPDYGTEEVADHALAMGLTLVRRMLEATSGVRRGGWDWRLCTPVMRVRGMTVGIVGLGRIGSAAALRWKAFGADVCFFDPFKDDGYDKALGIRRCETLEELLGQSSIVSLHVPLYDETRNLINPETLAQMKDDAVLVNTARGGVVDTTALATALDAGRLRGVGLDVLPSEPGSDDDPVYAGWRGGADWADKVMITPHTAFYCEQGLEEMRRKAARTVRRLLSGQRLRNVVNGIAEPPAR